MYLKRLNKIIKKGKPTLLELFLVDKNINALYNRFRQNRGKDKGD